MSVITHVDFSAENKSIQERVKALFGDESKIAATWQTKNLLQKAEDKGLVRRTGAMKIVQEKKSKERVEDPQSLSSLLGMGYGGSLYDVYELILR